MPLNSYWASKEQVKVPPQGNQGSDTVWASDWMPNERPGDIVYVVDHPNFLLPADESLCRMEFKDDPSDYGGHNGGFSGGFMLDNSREQTMFWVGGAHHTEYLRRYKLFRVVLQRGKTDGEYDADHQKAREEREAQAPYHVELMGELRAGKLLELGRLCDELGVERPAEVRKLDRKMYGGGGEYTQKTLASYAFNLYGDCPKPEGVSFCSYDDEVVWHFDIEKLRAMGCSEIRLSEKRRI